MNKNYDVVIIGCGTSGAAIAYTLSKYDLKVAVLEKENDVAMGTTRANSGILHAGYDPEPGTLMAKLNVRGVEIAKELAEKLGYMYRPVGSLVLAFSGHDVKTIKTLKARGDANGVKGCRILTKEEVQQMEPMVSENVVAALYAPSAICSPWELCLCMAETAVLNGTDLLLETEVVDISREKDGDWKVVAARNLDPLTQADAKDRKSTELLEFSARFVINAAGLFADKVHDIVQTVDADDDTGHNRTKPHGTRHGCYGRSEGEIRFGYLDQLLEPVLEALVLASAELEVLVKRHDCDCHKTGTDGDCTSGADLSPENHIGNTGIDYTGHQEDYRTGDQGLQILIEGSLLVRRNGSGIHFRLFVDGPLHLRCRLQQLVVLVSRQNALCSIHDGIHVHRGLGDIHSVAEIKVIPARCFVQSQFDNLASLVSRTSRIKAFYSFLEIVVKLILDVLELGIDDTRDP